MIEYYNKISSVLFPLLLLGISISLQAQAPKDSILSEHEGYKYLTLPPLDVLFENAKSAPRYELAKVQEEVQRRILNKEKRAFLNFFSLRGSWQYGNFTNDASYSDIVTPIINSTNEAEQTSYSVGAGVSIPLSDLFDLGPRIKRQKLILHSYELEKKIVYEDLKKEIIHLYASANTLINVLKLRAEAVILSNVQYAVVEKNFTNGTANSGDLALEKDKQSLTIERYESVKSELNKCILTLELITNTPILNK